MTGRLKWEEEAFILELKKSRFLDHKLAEIEYNLRLVIE